MPISGLVIRLSAGDGACLVRARLAGRAGLELGDAMHGALAGVIDAPDYAAHDALLEVLGRTEGVGAVDIVFHDFSDVSEFPRLPKRRRNTR